MVSSKPTYYDWTNRHFRMDFIYLSGPRIPPYNVSSYWCVEGLRFTREPVEVLSFSFFRELQFALAGVHS